MIARDLGTTWLRVSRQCWVSLFAYRARPGSLHHRGYARWNYAAWGLPELTTVVYDLADIRLGVKVYRWPG